MLYATLEDLIKRYTLDVLLSIARDDKRQLDEPKVYEALKDASDTIDSHLAGRYHLPLNAVPSVLERHCCYIARYFLEKNRATAQARLDYEDSIRFLEKVASGSISLGLSDMEEPVETDNAAMIESAGSVWDRKQARGFV